jgi:hypothetical protein
MTLLLNDPKHKSTNKPRYPEGRERGISRALVFTQQAFPRLRAFHGGDCMQPSDAVSKALPKLLVWSQSQIASDGDITSLPGGIRTSPRTISHGPGSCTFTVAKDGKRYTLNERCFEFQPHCSQKAKSRIESEGHPFYPSGAEKRLAANHSLDREEGV